MSIKTAHLGSKNSKKYTSYTRLRDIFFVFAIVLGVIMPFLKIGDRRVLMLSFLHKKLEFMGLVFDASQLYVIPFFIFMFASWILLCTALGGRVWCGWGCPQTIMLTVYRDFIQGFVFRLRSRNNKNRALRLDSFSKKLRFLGAIISWCIISVFIGAILSWYFVDPPEWFDIIASGRFDIYSGVYIFWLVMSGIIMLDVLLIQENFCKYICPYARIQAVFFDSDTALIEYDAKRGNNTDGSRGMKNFAGQFDKSGDCTNCLACVKVCPTGIDIRDGLQLGCIECLECVDACQPIMARKGLPNLIAWTTQQALSGKKSRFIRPRTLIYAGIFMLCFVGILLSIQLKKDVKMYLNSTNNTYQIYGDTVENNYFLLFTNRTDETKEFSIDINSALPLEILRPIENIILAPDSLLKKALIIQVPESDLADFKGQSSVGFSITVQDVKQIDQVLDTVSGDFFLPRN